MAKNKNTAPKTSTSEDTDWMKNDPVTVEAKADKKVKPGAKPVGKTAKAESVKPAAKAPAKPGSKPAAKTEPKAAIGRPSRIGDKKLKVVESELGKRNGLLDRVATAFGKGKTSAEVIEALSTSLDVPRSKVFEANPKGYLQGYISYAFKIGKLVEA